MSPNQFLQSPDFEEKDGYYYSEQFPNIRFSLIEDEDPIFGGFYTDLKFEVFKKPFFFGLIGKRKWEMSMQTNSFHHGLYFSKYLLEKIPLNHLITKSLIHSITQ